MADADEDGGLLAIGLRALNLLRRLVEEEAEGDLRRILLGAVMIGFGGGVLLSGMVFLEIALVLFAVQSAALDTATAFFALASLNLLLGGAAAALGWQRLRRRVLARTRRIASEVLTGTSA